MSSEGVTSDIMIYLHKILPFALSPLVLIIVIVAYGLFSQKKAYGLLGLVLLYASSTFVVADFLFEKIEGKGIKIAAKDAKPVDAIVVLSGMMMQVDSTAGPMSEWADADRFFAGIDLYEAGKAPRLIFTGGVLPWEKGLQSEGMVLKAFAQRMGVPASSISVSREAQNTAQEAAAVWDLFSSQAFHQPKILLVTSAFHMPRAQRLFERQGFAVEAFPVDFKVRAKALTPMDFLPDPRALSLTDLLVREWLGRFYYQLRTKFHIV
jgi:uncharacterized SAM-binding protein YcdF (DUF218 family)